MGEIQVARQDKIVVKSPACKARWPVLQSERESNRFSLVRDDAERF